MAHQSKDSCMWYDLHGKLEYKGVVQPLPELLPVAFDDHGQIIFPKELSHSSLFKGTSLIILQQVVLLFLSSSQNFFENLSSDKLWITVNHLPWCLMI